MCRRVISIIILLVMVFIKLMTYLQSLVILNCHFQPHQTFIIYFMVYVFLISYSKYKISAFSTYCI